MELPRVVTETVSGAVRAAHAADATEETDQLGISLPVMKDMEVPIARRESIRLDKFFDPGCDVRLRSFTSA
jgi:hypothetical protein